MPETDDDDAVVTEFYDTVSFDDDPRPWREVPETGLSEDEPHEGEDLVRPTS